MSLRADEKQPQSHPDKAKKAPFAVAIADRLAWSYAELEAITGLDRRTWERLVSAGKIKPIRIGRRVLFPRQVVLAFLEDQAKGGRAR